MISRYYFMAYITAPAPGETAHGSVGAYVRSWLPKHGDALEGLTLKAKERNGGRPVAVTAFYRVR